MGTTDISTDGSTVTMIYDALDRMVEQTRSTGHTEIVYGPYGMKLALMNGQSLVSAFVKIPGSGRAVYTSTGLTYYRHADHLGSSRLATKTTKGQRWYQSAYAPYGEDYAQAGDHPDLAFTDENQDTVAGGWATNLYDFMLREYRPSHGRWTSPDPAGLGAVDPTNPQTWNRYAYVENNPTLWTDPLGLQHPMCPAGFAYCNPAWQTWSSGWQASEFDLMSIPLVEETYTPAIPLSTPFTSMNNQNGYAVSVVIYQPGGWSDLIIGNAFDVEVLPMPSTFTWWRSFAKDLFSPKNFANEFKQGGCVNVFGNATLDALNPFSPGLSSAGEGTAAILSANQYNAAVQYAASAPNYLGGTGLIYPMKSSVVRSMVADANATAASGGLMSLDLALAQGFGTEMNSMATGGCR